MDRYIAALDAFAWQWKTLEPDEALAAITTACNGNSPASDAKAVADAVDFFRACVVAKDDLRRAFRPS